jgi:predicted dehydrogenase
MERGKAVLVEKPLTTEYGDALRLLKKSADLSLPVLAGHIYRFNNSVRKAADIIHSGILGQVSHIKIEWKALWSSPLPQRDILFDLGPHPFDITNILIKEWPASIRSSFHDPRLAGVNEIAYLQAKYSKRKTVHIELSWVFPTKTRSVAVIGDKNSLQMDCLNQRLTLFTRNRAQTIDVERNNTMKDELLYFANCCDIGRDPKGLGQIGLEVVRILDRTIRKNLPKTKRS